jgi:O-antigen ligase
MIAISRQSIRDWWHSRTSRTVDAIATIAAVVLVLRVGWQEDLSWVAACAVASVALSVTLIGWPYGLLALLIAASAMPVYYVEVFGWNARPEHFAAFFGAIAVGVWLCSGRGRLQLNRLDYWILFFVGANFLSSAFGSSDPASTLRWAVQNCLAVLFYFLIRVLVQDSKLLGRAFDIWLVVAVAESVYGIFSYASHQVFGTTFGVMVGQYLNDVAAPFGSMYEANLFGAYAASTAVACLSLYLFAGHRLRYLICFLVTGIAAFISFSRAGLVALLLVGGYLFSKSHRNSAEKASRKFVAVGALVLLFLVLFSGPLGQIVRERFANLFYEGLTEETAISRVIVMQEALQEIPGHLLIGRGTASFNLTFDWNRFIPSWASDKTWIGNAPLRILHDTGLLGLASIVGFFVTAWIKIRHRLKIPSPKDCLVVALWAGIMIYAISFQFTDGTILAFTWVQLGLLASAVSISPS